MAFVSDVNIDQGTSFTETFFIQTLTNPALPLNAVTNPYIPLSLIGSTFNMMVRPDYDSGVVLTATLANGKITCPSPATGYFSLVLLPSDTAVIRFTGDSANYVYDISITDSFLNVIRPIQGAFNISREVSR